ncbi:MAG: hypothetical protein LQ349_006935 [Xanthoria aureola]|nr:MAG: hypothetical protein LQ349_006935 [Xanthoria aureola]
MLLRSGAAVVVAFFITGLRAQTSASLSDCHNHGATRYCVLPNGEETAVPSSITEAPSVATAAPATADAQTTAVTSCHMHETAQFCIKGDGGEVMAVVTASAIGPSPPAQYTGCHSHGEELFCYGPDSEETLFAAEAAAAAVQTGASSEGQNEGSSSGGRNCHFHAGVEHCLEPGESEGGSAASATACNKVDRSYNMPIRIGTLFVMLITSSIAVFGPILLVRFAHVHPGGYIFTVLKQFGTGVIISTALVHLLTHAELMFGNECLGELKYEATTTAIVVAGAFLTFLLQYSSLRLSDSRARTVASKSGIQHAESMNGDASDKSSQVQVPTAGHDHRMPKLDDPLSVLILEMGIIFHSAIIGVTLVVAGDSFYKILVVVIIFHQMFEGLALGVRISHLSTISLLKKLLMGSGFALITPLGMAIGLGVLDSFNGNDKATIIAIGTLDAFSAGILLWTGFIQMWSFDWLYGDLRDAGAVQTGLGMFALVAGLVIMSVLGKWA